MAEKAMHKHALCIALSYDDTTQENRDASAMFAYADVRGFLKRLRSAARYADPAAEIRFLCAGEQGDRFGRCHWHLILFSSVDLTALGCVQRLKGGKRVVETDRAEMFTVGKRKRRLNWSLWPNGFVTFQEPDQGGMHYVLSYCLKDQFTAEKSQGTMREATSENFATGLFRMSKRPAIGEAWLMQKMAMLDENHSCLPSLNLKVPDFHGFYQPSGSFRKKLLWSLVALNQRALWLTGAPAPQWAALLASCNENLSDMEILLGPETEDPENVETIDNELQRVQREHSGRVKRSEFARTCGASLPCQNCLERLPDETLARLGVERVFDIQQGETVGVYQYRPAQGFASISARQRKFAARSNPYCQKRGSALSRHTFANSDRTKLGPKL